VQLSEKVLIVVNGTLPQEDIVQLEGYGDVFLRENNGYDAAGFRAGSLQLLEEGLDNFDELLLVNDTSVGPFKDLCAVFEKMSVQKLDFWGISYGGQSHDVTGFNKYGYIPKHLQSYFLVIEKSMFSDASFKQYWQELGDTSTRDMAIGKHETVFTKYFEDLGFAHGALSYSTLPGGIYFHPLTLIQEDDVPLVKYTAFENTEDVKFEWHGYTSHSEIPALLEYIKNQTDYPLAVVEGILDDLSKKVYPTFTLVIYEQMDEQLQTLIKEDESIKAFEKSAFHISSGEHAQKIIYYKTQELPQLSKVAKMANIPIEII
jgi:lipopolysaccharide biosynthesis protein